ncbi:MAG: ester cyclase [Bacteroidales bacterium]|nr:ester cyclase [Bacteroidales bacterium]
MKTNNHINKVAIRPLVSLILIFVITLSVQAQDKKTCQANKDLIKEYLGALSGKEKTAAVMDKYIADADSILKRHIMEFEASFPKYELIPEDMIAEGDKVAVRARFKGIHSGPMGDIQATNKKADMPAAIIYRIGDGKIIEHWIFLDQLTLLKQLGIM